MHFSIVQKTTHAESFWALLLVNSQCPKTTVKLIHQSPELVDIADTYHIPPVVQVNIV